MSQENPKEISLKLILLGGQGCGKTSLMKRYVDGVFEAPTVSCGVDILFKRLVIDGINVRVQYWDTAGQERFHSIVSSFYNRVDGAMLVYDIKSLESFETLKKYINDLNLYASQAYKIIICNKTDFNDEEELLQKGKLLAEQLEWPFFETSAKENKNVEKAFLFLTEELVKCVKSNPWRFNREDTFQPRREPQRARMSEAKSYCCLTG